MLETSSKKLFLKVIFRDMIEEVMDCGTDKTPLHLKLAAF
jgi:hypothetical protein